MHLKFLNESENAKNSKCRDITIQISTTYKSTTSQFKSGQETQSRSFVGFPENRNTTAVHQRQTQMLISNEKHSFPT